MKSLASNARFAALPALHLLAFGTFLAGGGWTWLAGAIIVVGGVLGDELLGEDHAPVARPIEPFLTGLLYSALPLTVLNSVALLLYTASPGSLVSDTAIALGVPAARDGGWIALAGAIYSVGMLFGCTVFFAHELCHRGSRLSWWSGQFILAQSLYAPLAIEHIHGHHRNVGLPHDIMTAPRGMSFWRFLLRAVLGAHRGSAAHEARRLGRRNLPWYSWQNRYLQGLALQFVLAGGVFLIGGLGGLAGYALSAPIAMAFADLTNYVSHYGLVRVSGRPVRSRHSWNSPRVYSSSFSLNVQRHSDHHRLANRPFWRLRVLDGAPVLPLGMSLLLVIALIPPLWFRVIKAPLEQWDRKYASAEELALVGKDALVPARKKDPRRAKPARSGV